MDELKGAIKVCALMQTKEADGSAFDGNYYWNLIHSEESKGQKFFETAKDYLEFEIEILDRLFGSGNKNVKEIVIVCIIVAVLLGIEQRVFYDGRFFDGFLIPLTTFGILSIVLFPAFLLRNKEKTKKQYMKYV